MRNVVLAALLAGLCPSFAGALEIKNVRPTFGPTGALRGKVEAVPGDFVFLSYDIEGLNVNAKTGKVSYVTTVELLDPSNKSLFSKDTPMDLILQLGGNRIPGDLYITTGPKQTPGKYTIKLTVNDKQGKETKSVTYPFDLVPETFGFALVTAPAVGLPGQSYAASFALVHMAFDSKKMPNVEVRMSVLDDAGKPVANPVFASLPRDIPEGIDIQKENFVPLTYPVYLNRPGHFTIEITALDNVAKKQKQLRFGLTVIDVSTLSAK
jgi:hypothetical protein